MRPKLPLPSFFTRKITTKLEEKESSQPWFFSSRSKRRKFETPLSSLDPSPKIQKNSSHPLYQTSCPLLAETKKNSLSQSRKLPTLSHFLYTLFAETSFALLRSSRDQPFNPCSLLPLIAREPPKLLFFFPSSPQNKNGPLFISFFPLLLPS